MWKAIEEIRLMGAKPIKAMGVQRDDGFKVVREWQDDWPHYEYSGHETFSCTGPLGTGRFVVSHREKGKQTNTYIVYLWDESVLNPDLCRAYAKDIEAAFVDGPWKIYRTSEIEKVTFMVAPATEPLPAEELYLFMYTRGFDEHFDLIASRKDNSKWQLMAERRIYKTTFQLDEVNRPYEIIGIKRNDGFTITLEGSTEDGNELFLCKTHTNKFGFSVKRWGPNDTHRDCIRTKYLLSLYWFYENWPGNMPDNIALCREHREDIEAGLLNFPLVRMFPGYTPIKEVVFKIGEHYMTVDEVIQP